MIRSSLLLLALASASLVALPPAWADIPVPGTHRQNTDARIDFGPFADYATRVHILEAGDTYGALAQQWLGSAKRWKEIADLNPGYKADKLPIGKELLLPPAKTPLRVDQPAKAGGAQHRWDFFAVGNLHQRLQRVRPGVDVPWGPYGASLLAVRHDQLAAFRRLLASARGRVLQVADGQVKSGADWVARSKEEVAGRGGTRESDPVYAIRVESRVTSIKNGIIELETISKVHLDRDGKVLSKQQIKQASTRWHLALIAIAAAGLAGLFFVTRRRRSGEPSPTT